MPSSLGIDQGLKGGLCWLTGLLSTDPQYVIPMPTRKSVGSGKRPDIKKIKAWLGELIRDYGLPSMVVIERTQAMSKGKDAAGVNIPQGVKGAMTSGFNSGMIVAIFEFMELPTEEPTPQMWKAAVLKGFGEKNKDAMFTVCRQRFPALVLRSGPRATKDHDGMADAVGLALYGQYRVGNVPA